MSFFIKKPVINTLCQFCQYLFLSFLTKIFISLHFKDEIKIDSSLELPIYNMCLTAILTQEARHFLLDLS